MAKARRFWVRNGTLRVAAVGILFILATASRQASAFRSAGDTSGFEGTEQVRWVGERVLYQIHRTVPAGVSADELRELAERAFQRWSDATNGKITCEFGGFTDSNAASEDGANTIQFVTSGWGTRGYASDAAGLTEITYVKEPTGTWTIGEADIYLNADDHEWIAAGEGNPRERDLDSVLTHEGGHFLGLMHPCEIDGADGAPDCADDTGYAETAMYPVYSPDQVTLTDDDTQGADYLYGNPACDDQSCPNDGVCKTDGCHEPCNGQLCAADEHCTAEGCWPNEACSGSDCNAECKSDIDCGVGQHCLDAACVVSRGAGEDGADSANTAKYPLGSSCQSAAECMGSECLTGAGATNLCTQTCTIGRAEGCPDGWSCEVVDSRTVCAPELFIATGGGGCAVGRVAVASSGGRALLLAGLGVVLVQFTRRRRRDARRRRPS